MTKGKKFINNPKKIAHEAIEGYLAANQKRLIKIGEGNTLVGKRLPKNCVGVLVGGGMAAEPLFPGYVGKNMADCAVIGNINAAPSPFQILDGTRAIDRGQGVLYVFCKYPGDILTFDMAAELAEEEGIRTRTIMVVDDIGSAPKGKISERHGIVGAIFVIKIAGSAASSGLNLDEVFRIASMACENTRSIIIAARSGYYLETGELMFELPKGLIGMGVGLHGEPGLGYHPMRMVDSIVKDMLDMLLDDLNCKAGDEITMMINNMGATSIVELFIINHCANMILKEKGIILHHTDIGSFYTSQDMVGFSISFMKLNNELKKYFDMPADSFSYSTR